MKSVLNVQNQIDDLITCGIEGKNRKSRAIALLFLCIFYYEAS
jgi:hypothetical protein